MNPYVMELSTIELAFHHLRHEHPLEYLNAAPPRAQDMHCSGCELNVLPGMGYYYCKTCSFVLHQVCYNMPRKLKHPAHVNHPLTLFDAPSNPASTGNLTCWACGHRINSLYYGCEICHIFHHALCSALPLNVSINNHPHILKLEYYLPYGFRCGLCSKPSHKGWVYRCSLCEFDMHLGCAILNQKGESYQQSPVSHAANAVLRASCLCKASDTERANHIKVTMSKELTILVAQNMARGVAEVAESVEVVNPDLTKENLGIGNGRNINSEFSHVEQPTNDDNSALISLDVATPSCQFSDACFSIDLAKSYSTIPAKHQTEKEPKHQNPAIISRMTEEASSTGYMALSNHKHEIATVISFNNKAIDGKLNEALFSDWTKSHSTHHINKMERNSSGKGAMARSDTRIQSEISDIATSSCCVNVFGCCYQRNYKQMFKDGGS